MNKQEPKVIQIQTSASGEHGTIITTVLYDDGSVYEGYYKCINDRPRLANPKDRIYKMEWMLIDLPK